MENVELKLTPLNSKDIDQHRCEINKPLEGDGEIIVFTDAGEKLMMERFVMEFGGM